MSDLVPKYSFETQIKPICLALDRKARLAQSVHKLLKLIRDQYTYEDYEGLTLPFLQAPYLNHLITSCDEYEKSCWQTSSKLESLLRPQAGEY